MSIRLKQYIQLLLLVALCFALASCQIFDGRKCTPAPVRETVQPYIYLGVVDKTTGNNLLFGSSAIYKLAQVKAYHLVNGQPDSIRLFADSTHNSFLLQVQTVHSTDTVIMNIASLPQDEFLFKTGIVQTCYPYVNLTAVMYNGLNIYASLYGSGAAVIEK